MKPLQLSITAFGPFASTQIIDFRALGERSFFLIHGPTGAGKTTILDAICFALYGETSGNERKGEQMRSHHTKSSIPTEVTFDFALGQEVYRVTRSLKREKPKDGDSEPSYKPDKAILWRCIGSEAEETTQVEVASKWTKVTEAIESLFGFESRQFRQVMMLPQDKFQQLLKANSREREDLFKTLFQTQQFERVEQALKKEEEGLEKDLKRLTDQRELVLRMAQVSSPAELANKRQATVESLQMMRDHLASLRAIEKQAADRLAQGQDAQSKISEREQADVHLQQMESKQVEFEAKRKALERARLAAELVELENAAAQEMREATQTERKREEENAKLVEARKAQQKAAGALARELQRQSERDEARREQDRLQNLQGQVQDLEIAQRSLREAREQATRFGRERDGVKAQRDRLQEQLTQLQSLPQAETIALQLSSAQQAEVNARQVHDQWKNLDSITRQLKTAQDKEYEARQRLQEAESNLTHARERRDMLEEAWHAEQAAILASQLMDNVPCPVCGSIHHPHPAISSQTPPSETELKNARAAVTNLEAQSQTIRTEWTQHRDEVVRLVT